MELHQLEYFVAVAEERSFTRAAERVHVAQSGVSAQVRKLERELGQSLLERSPRSVRLNEVGAAVLPHARAVLDAAARVRMTVEEHTGLLRGRVAIGTVTSWTFLDLPGLLDAFHQAHPGVEITLSEGNSDLLLSELERGNLDLAVIGIAGARPPGIEAQVLLDEPFVAAVSHRDPLAGRARMPLTGLRERALISLPRGTGQRTALEGACAAAGFEPKIGFEAGDPRMLADLAARALGVAILPRSLAAARAEQLHSIVITRPALRGRIELAWRAPAPLTPAARALMEHARSALVPQRRSAVEA